MEKESNPCLVSEKSRRFLCQGQGCMEMFQCWLCPMFFNSKAKLMKHKRMGHFCEFCNVSSIHLKGKIESNELKSKR